MKRFFKIFVLVITFLLISIQALAVAETNDKVNILGNIEIDQPLTGNIVSMFGSVDINQPVSGDVVVILGNIDIESTVNGEVVAVLGNVRLASNASIMGDVVAIGGRGIERSEGAHINGESVSISLGSKNINQLDIPFISHLLRWIGFGTILILGLIAATLSSAKIERMVISFEQHFIKKFIIGIIGVFCFIITVPFLAITIIGLPLAIIFFIIITFTGFACINVYIGQKILELFNGKSNMYGEYIIGAIITAIVLTTFQFSLWLSIIIIILSLGLGIDMWFAKTKDPKKVV